MTEKEMFLDLDEEWLALFNPFDEDDLVLLKQMAALLGVSLDEQGQSADSADSNGDRRVGQ